MTAKYSDMIRAIQAHDKGLLRYSRYSGESVNTLLAAVKNDARGNFNLMHAAEMYVNSNFIDVNQQVKKTDFELRPAIIESESCQKQRKTYVECIERCRILLMFLKFTHYATNAELAARIKINTQTVGAIINKKSGNTEKSTEEKIVQYAESLGIKFEDAEKYVLSLNASKVA